MTKEESNIVFDTEIKEKVEYNFILNERIMKVNQSFDNNDRNKIKETLRSFYDTLIPYMDSKKKSKYKKKIIQMKNITDKEEFLDVAHDFYQDLLLFMKRRKLLMREIPKGMG